MPLPTPRLSRALSVLAALLAAALALASCGGADIVEIGIVERFDDPAVDDARDGFLEAMDAVGFRATEEVRYFRFNAESSEFPLDEIVEELVVEEEVDVLLAIGADALRAAVEGARGQAIFFALATDDTIGGLTDRWFWHEAIAAGAFAPAVGLVEMVSPALPNPDLIASSRLAVLVVPDELDSVAAARLGAESIGRSGLEVMEIEVADAASVADAVREAAEADADAIALTPSALLDDALEDILAAAASVDLPVVGTRRDHVLRGAYAARGPVTEENGRIAGQMLALFLLSGGIGVASVSLDTPVGLWLSRPAADAFPAPLDEIGADVVEVID